MQSCDSVTGAVVCAQHCPVVLTDHNEEVLSVLERNAALNRDGTSHGGASVFLTGSRSGSSPIRNACG